MTRDGNVIFGDFRPQPALSVDISVDYEVLFCDEDVVLVRASGSIAGRPFMFHTMAERGACT